MPVAIGGDSQGPLIDSREAALAFAEECGLAATPGRCLLLLMSAETRLLSTELLAVASLEDLDPGQILRAARKAGASAFLLVTCSPLQPAPALRRKVSELAAICGEYGVDFVDYLSIAEGVARSLVWDPAPARHDKGPNPWSTG